MQPLETSPDIWRRASPSPAPDGFLEVSSATPTALRGSHAAATRGRPRGALLIGLVLLLAIAAGSLVSRAAPLAELERWIALAGFDLREAAVTGQRFTPDGDLFEAIDLEHARTLLSFDARVVKARLEALPWVEEASITRILPDRVEVRISERTPVAQWHHNGLTHLIDRTGRVLALVPRHSALPLPQLAGAGAPQAVAGLLALLAAYPRLAPELALAERVGERRWRLRLTGGTSIDLPTEGAGEALARALAIAARLPHGSQSIDVRVAGRALLREAAAGPPSAPPLSGL